MDAYVLGITRIYLILIQKVAIYFPVAVDIYGHEYEVLLLLARV